VAQHRAVIGPDEATHQGRHRHAITPCDSMGLRFGGECAPQCGVVEIHNK